MRGSRRELQAKRPIELPGECETRDSGYVTIGPASPFFTKAEAIGGLHPVRQASTGKAHTLFWCARVVLWIPVGCGVLDIVGPVSRADLGMEHSNKCREIDTWWQPPFLYAIYFLLKRHAAWWVIYAPFAGGMASVFENVGARIRAHGTLVSSPAPGQRK